MWYEILPSFVIMTGCLIVPGVATSFIHRYTNGWKVSLMLMWLWLLLTSRKHLNYLAKWRLVPLGKASGSGSVAVVSDGERQASVRDRTVFWFQGECPCVNNTTTSDAWDNACVWKIIILIHHTVKGDFLKVFLLFSKWSWRTVLLGVERICSITRNITVWQSRC